MWSPCAHRRSCGGLRWCVRAAHVAASAGAACHADAVQMSHVLKAMGVEPGVAMDLRTGWDFDKEADRQRARAELECRHSQQ